MSVGCYTLLLPCYHTYYPFAAVNLDTRHEVHKEHVSIAKELTLAQSILKHNLEQIATLLQLTL